MRKRLKQHIFFSSARKKYFLGLCLSLALFQTLNMSKTGLHSIFFLEMPTDRCDSNQLYQGSAVKLGFKPQMLVSPAYLVLFFFGNAN